MLVLSLIFMKKWVGFILSLYILVSVAIPCCVFDACEEEEKTEQYAQNESEENCNDCSPFSFCSITNTFTVNTINTSIGPVELSKPFYNNYYQFSTLEYHSSLFQPPRLS